MSSTVKSKSKHRLRWGSWSEWIWSDEHQRYYRYRRDDNDNYDYEWEAVAAPASEEEGQGGNVPRQEVDLAADMEELNIEEASPSAHRSDYYYGASTTGSKSGKSKSSRSNRKGKSVSYDVDEEQEVDEETPEDPRYSRHAGYSERTGSKRKGQSSGGSAYRPEASSEYSYATHTTKHHGSGYSRYDPQGEPDPHEDYRPTTEEADYASGGHSHGPAYGSDPRVASAPDEEYTLVEETENAEAQYAEYAGLQGEGGYSDPAAYGPIEEGEDPEIEHLKQQSRQEMYYGHHGGSSMSDPVYGPAASSFHADEEGSSTPRPSSPRIAGTGGEIEVLDPRYRIEASTRFQPGEVFKVLWSEPQGQVGGTPTLSDKKEIRNQFGSFYVGFRRFIVVANDEGHATCVPILTYGSKGCKKRGVKPHKHGIIVERGHRPRTLDGEPELGFPPVRMRMEVQGEKLAKESRINFSKLVTVEHNVKVFFIGHIVPEDWDVVRDAVNRCWEDKIHSRRRKYTAR